ncbi:cell division protein ZapE [Roseixanthobacter liquoris]|uniref:cell division protein ZapE n=1 Tax=Roseixanthobacter liquoris TaxID=3119921 RepID=UPI003727224E
MMAAGARVLSRYEAMVRAGEITPDPAQAAVIQAFARLEVELRDRLLARKSSALGWLFHRRTPTAPRGLYIYGEVGRGKTMLMDLFFESVEVRAKRRAHFHEFMADVHDRIFAERQAQKRGERKTSDPLQPVADDLAKQVQLLCFDEFHVTDIADAMILGRLFQKLFADGVVVVATSNVKPDDLYAGGLNRSLFLPFIAMIDEKMEVLNLDARTDYRMEKLEGLPVWYEPLGPAAHEALDRAWAKIAGPEGGRPTAIANHSRLIPVPLAGNGAARFSFADLCEQPLGAGDYLRISRAFHTVVIEGIPVMDGDHRNEAKRFISLIDTFYDGGVKLIASAAAEPEKLYLGSQGAEAFEFARTVSRLHEMRSTEYLGRTHGRADSAASGNTTGLVET